MTWVTTQNAAAKAHKAEANGDAQADFKDVVELLCRLKNGEMFPPEGFAVAEWWEGANKAQV